MGLLDRLFGGRFSLPPADEPAISDAEAMRALYPFKRALAAFAQALLQPLPDAERRRLVRRVMRVYNLGEAPTTALLDAVLDPEKGQSPLQPILLAVDVRGFDQFEYQAPLLVAARGMAQPYGHGHDGVSPMTEVLAGLDQWLRAYGQRLLYLANDGDQYVAVIVEQGQVDALIALAARAQITLRLSVD